MRSKQFLDELRQNDALKRAVLNKLVVEGKTVTFHIVTDVTYGQEDVSYAKNVASRYTPRGYTAEVKLLKSVPDAAGIRKAVADFLKKRFPAVAAFISPEEIEVVCDKSGGRFFIPIDKNDRALLTADGVLDALHDELCRSFCGTWYGDFRFEEKEKGEIEEEGPPPAERILPPRSFKIVNYDPIDGAEPKDAIYIADLKNEAPNISVCGSISYIDERLTKNGKPWFSITVSDGTGVLRASYFSKKATIEKVRSLRHGDSVVLTGNNELWGGSLSFRVKAIDRGSAPAGFKPEALPSRPVPAQYRAVFPAPEVNMVQGGLFDEDRLPPSFKKRDFVVVDLETTGLNINAVAGSIDKIIEIGAVKIRDGKIAERFSSFVACPVKLPDEIVRITGITDDMLIGAPPVSDVIADFYKFCAGAELVAHNGIMFDFKFIRYYGEKEGYLFDHPQHDTLYLAQELLPMLSNHKLDTVAEKYGFTFNHHRAYDDAFVTAKIFLEFAKIKSI